MANARRAESIAPTRVNRFKQIRTDDHLTGGHAFIGEPFRRGTFRRNFTFVIKSVNGGRFYNQIEDSNTKDAVESAPSSRRDVQPNRKRVNALLGLQGRFRIRLPNDLFVGRVQTHSATRLVCELERPLLM